MSKDKSSSARAAMGRYGARLVAPLGLAALLASVAGSSVPKARPASAVVAPQPPEDSSPATVLVNARLPERSAFSADRQSMMRAQLCLTAAIYYEAASESEAGQRAVAQVILNRVRHPAWPATVCGVVYQASDMPVCQFSYSCDGSMARRPDRAGWDRAARIAEEALKGHAYAPVGFSTFYHTLSVDPEWNRAMIPTKVIGNHIFYRLPGRAGTSASFSQHYAGTEPMPGPLPRRLTPEDLARAQVAASKEPPALRAERSPVLARTLNELPGALPAGDALPQYAESGRWIGD